MIYTLPIFLRLKQKLIISLFSAIILVLMLNENLLAQSENIKSLHEKLKTAKKDTDKVNAYYALSKFYWNRNSDSALFFAQQSLTLSKALGFQKGIALANISKGLALVSKAQLPEALAYYFEALRISEELGLTEVQGNALNAIGIVYAQLKDFPKALYFYKKSYKIAIQQKKPDKHRIHSVLVNIGEIFKDNSKSDSAIVYNQKALSIATQLKDSLGIAITLYNIGENLMIQGKYPLALKYINKSLSIATATKDVEGIVYCHSAFALINYYTGNYQLSLYYGKMAFEENKQLGIQELGRVIDNTLYMTYLKMGDYNKALYFRNLEIALKDSVIGIERSRMIAKMSVIELEKKQQQVDGLRKEKLIDQKELTNIKLKRDFITVCALSLLCIVVFLVRNYLAKRKLILKLEEQNNEIVAKNKHLEELILVRNRMFSIIGHDLRGPIHSIKGMMEMLGMEELDEEEKKFFIEKASQSLNVTANLIDNLLYWAKSQMDGMQTKPTHFDIQKLIKQNIVLIEGRASDKKIALQIDEHAEDLTVFADETMIDIVLRNLIENAVKFLNAGNCITIKAQLKTEQNEVIVSVKDDGVGIALEAQDKIFNKYTSYSTYGTNKEKGSGLGLLLCKELVEKNQGKIWFESKPNEGTSFFFSIPVA